MITKPRIYQKFKQIFYHSNKCQVCLSVDKQVSHDGRFKDQLISCQLCMSSIHQTHYGSELREFCPNQWYCERCRYLLRNKDQNKIIPSCEFCPEKKGIMKLIESDKKKVWSHPQCIIWDFPLRTFTCYKFEVVKKLSRSNIPTQKYWHRDFVDKRCKLCDSSRGEFLKCKYYTCSTYFHVTCARKIGVVRELERMRVQPQGIYIPVYCADHLQLRGKDFRKKANLAGDREKVRFLNDLAKIYERQFEELKKAEESEREQVFPQICYIEAEEKPIKQPVQEGSQISDTVSKAPEGLVDKSVYRSSLCQFLQKQLPQCVERPILRTIDIYQKFDPSSRILLEKQKERQKKEIDANIKQATIQLSTQQAEKRAKQHLESQDEQEQEDSRMQEQKNNDNQSNHVKSSSQSQQNQQGQQEHEQIRQYHEASEVMQQEHQAINENDVMQEFIAHEHGEQPPLDSINHMLTEPEIKDKLKEVFISQPSHNFNGE